MAKNGEKVISIGTGKPLEGDYRPAAEPKKPALDRTVLQTLFAFDTNTRDNPEKNALYQELSRAGHEAGYKPKLGSYKFPIIQQGLVNQDGSVSDAARAVFKHVIAHTLDGAYYLRNEFASGLDRNSEVVGIHSKPKGRGNGGPKKPTNG